MIDETSLNVLLAEGIDVPTSAAGSLVDDPPSPLKASGRVNFDLGLIVGIVAVLAWLLK